MAEALKIALVQLDCRIGEVENNVEHMLALAGEAAANGAKMICFPEACFTGYSFLKAEYMPPEKEDSVYIRKMCDFAASHAVYLEFCIIYQEEGRERPYMAAFFVGPDGKILGQYNKNHLFGEEKLHFMPGETYPVFDTEYGKIGIMVCYDGNFPEPARILATQGAEIILAPAAWAYGDGRLFDMLMPARAVENVCYVCAVDRFGTDEGRKNAAHSMICGPQGRIEAFAKDCETIVYGQLSADYVREQRKAIPYLQDRRPEEYRKFA